jgi:hypothetical protein
MTWFKNAAGRHGEKGAKGDIGELFFVDAYRAKGWNVIHYGEDRSKQLAGIDVEIVRPDGVIDSIDVKSNLKSDNSFAVEIDEKGWLFNPRKKGLFICHVNVDTKMLARYRRKTMQDYIRKGLDAGVLDINKYYMNNLVWIKPNGNNDYEPNFISWGSVNDIKENS